MSKLISVLVAVLIIAVSAAYAMPATRLFGTAGTIAMVECQDHECKVGCRTLHKMPTDSCTTPPFRHDEGMKVLCAAAPANELCYTFSVFKKDNTTTNTSADCTDANLQFTAYHQCGVCRPSHFDAKKFEITTGCNSSTTMTVNLECDEGCKVCNKTHKIVEKECVVPTKGKFEMPIMFSAPARCQKQIQYIRYNNSECSGQGEIPPMPEYSNVCYSMMGRSHMYLCQ